MQLFLIQKNELLSINMLYQDKIIWKWRWQKWLAQDDCLNSCTNRLDQTLAWFLEVYSYVPRMALRAFRMSNDKVKSCQ